MKTGEKFFINGKPTEALIKLLSILGVDHQGTLASIKDATQKNWYQQGKLRAQISEDKRYVELMPELMQLFRQLGLVDAIYAPQPTYDVALLHGATLAAVQKRIAFLAQEWERGVRFKKIGFVCSHRELLKEKDDVALVKSEVFGIIFNTQAIKLYDDEASMTEAIYEIASLPWKGKVSNEFLNFVGEAGANTKSTLMGWKQKFKDTTLNSLLFVSSQPFVSFQQIIAEKIFDLDQVRVNTIGYAAPDTIPVAAYLDNVAKIIYELAS